MAYEIARLKNNRRPHLVYMNIDRSQMDANREVNEATFGDPGAIKYYNEYASRINEVGAISM